MGENEWITHAVSFYICPVFAPGFGSTAGYQENQ